MNDKLEKNYDFFFSRCVILDVASLNMLTNDCDQLEIKQKHVGRRPLQTGGITGKVQHQGPAEYPLHSLIIIIRQS